MQIKKVLLFYNPNAGNGLFSANLDLIIQQFQKKKMVVIPIRADRKGFLNEILKNLNQNEYVKVIAAGGDGTINIMVNAMMENNIDLPLSIFPAGTANDFAYYFDIPNKINDMVNIALEKNYTYADVGKVNSKYFINVAALGFLVDVSQKTDPNIKNTLGIVSYYLRGVVEIPNLRPIPIKITSKEYTAEEKIFFMLVMNGRSAGGFKRIAPSAEINDGYLDVLLFKEMPIYEFAPLFLNIMQGNHSENKNVKFFKTQELLIESNQDIGTDIDGEVGEKLPLHIKVISKKLKINTLIEGMKGSSW